MANFFDNLLNKGKLPDLVVKAEVDDKSILKLSIALIVVFTISILLNAFVLKKIR